MIVSPGSVEDAPRVAALFLACFDDRLITVAGIRHRQISAQPEDELRFWRAEEGGELDRLVVRRPRCVRRCAHDGERGHRRPSRPPPRRSRLRALGPGLRPSRRDRRSSHRRLQPGRCRTRWPSSAPAASASRAPTPRRPSTRERFRRRRNRRPGSRSRRWRSTKTTPRRCSRPTRQARSTSRARATSRASRTRPGAA